MVLHDISLGLNFKPCQTTCNWDKQFFSIFFDFAFKIFTQGPWYKILNVLPCFSHMIMNLWNVRVLPEKCIPFLRLSYDVSREKHTRTNNIIKDLEEGPRGLRPPFLILFSKCFWNASVTLLLHVLKSEVFIRGWGGGKGGGLGLLFVNFLDPRLNMISVIRIYRPGVTKYNTSKKKVHGR